MNEEKRSNEEQPSSTASTESPRPAHSDVLGVARLFIDLKVSMAEMRDWEPSRITAFFHGVAQAQRAANGFAYGSPAPARLFCSCGATVTEEQHQVHHQRGHDAGQ